MPFQTIGLASGRRPPEQCKVAFLTHNLGEGIQYAFVRPNRADGKSGLNDLHGVNGALCNSSRNATDCYTLTCSTTLLHHVFPYLLYVPLQ